MPILPKIVGKNIALKMIASTENREILNSVPLDAHVVEGFGDLTSDFHQSPALSINNSNAMSIAGSNGVYGNAVPIQPLKAPSSGDTSNVILKWDKLKYEVKTKAGKNIDTRVILNEITGQVCAGETIAIIGSSGAGKTTLLNALSSRIVGGSLSGQVLFHGRQRNPGTYKRLTAYVQQDDIMHAMLTVNETLSYASRLRLPNSQYTQEEKSERVASIIKKLRLEGIRNSQIGNAKTRGVSGGERKRVSIGAELLTDPHLLFLDEPTSGLDSNSSQLVVELIKQVTRERQIGAMMTIHQPSARIFNTFDKVILLSQGCIVYFGPTATAIDYFAGIGYQCPMHENPADYFIDLMTLDFRTKEALADSRSRVAGLAQNFIEYRSKHKQADNMPGLHAGEKSELTSVSDAPLVEASPRNSWIFEYKTLVHRDSINLMRNMTFLLSQGVQSLVTALIVGFMFFYLKHDAISVQNRLGVLYIIVLNATFPVVMPSLQTFVQERDIMLRERASAVYRVTTFYVAKATSFIPIALITGIIFILGVYFISHLVFDTGKFFIALGIFACLNIVSVAFMLLIGCSVENIDIAFVIGPAILTLQLLFGGLLANPSTITPVLRWLRWINPVYYAYAALIRNEFTGMTFECDSGEQCYENGEQVVATYSMDHFSIWANALFLLLIAAVYFVSGYAMLRWKIKPKYIWI
ncbi:hypothetical protein COEREDRAFT_82231 [Coemansia reversa NRRL 1564]|uniref:ABC transporter domain-containing protein n=1 Tax=Coemansia reversa (strain ATCC 12441 / NRRL 1564) TaxID=763665 RepID=A0A2G5B8E6_COERN|nr:hypothetical protein COEREDRAFT_82231 [Coemansia reversa NRRL 1564]|eukprot:PIA15271.1 hypothetical protein COEREDRAFT_82231 [Coemansia reversa NRRL 1564]